MSTEAAETYAATVRAAEAEHTAAYDQAKAVHDAAVAEADAALEAALEPARAVRDAAVALALAEYEQAEGIVREPIGEPDPHDAATVVEDAVVEVLS